MHFGAKNNHATIIVEQLGESMVKKDLSILADRRVNGMQCQAPLS